ncbi:MAG TPA: hypothetical protein PLY93_02175 [Turneriella sp.]|nr:hypothetical protein [Turneriella sp.]
MAFVKLLFVFSLFFSLNAIPVEYELDKPLDFNKTGRFVHTPNLYVQHQCSATQVKKLVQEIAEFSTKKSPLSVLDAPLQPLQVRLFKNAKVYRDEFHFSKHRHAHYNERLEIVTSYCDAPFSEIEEQWILHRLAETRLRTWQKYFLAETIAHPTRAFRETGQAKPVSFLYLFLSNHKPDNAERKTMHALFAYLMKKKVWDSFCEALLLQQNFDDTGIEIFEKLTGEPITNGK